MNLHVFCIHISIMLLLQYALSKTLPKAIEIDSEVSDSSDDSESLHDTNHHSLKHSKRDRSKGHSRRRRASEEKSSIKKQCAVMYKNDEPVGILQPYKDSYQFLPIHSDEQIPVEISPYSDESQNSVKRDTSLSAGGNEDAPELGDDTLKQEDSSPFSDERYPYIFAKFKVDSRIERPLGSGNLKQRALYKRESGQSLVDERHSESLSSTLSRIKRNDEGAEIELRSILSDMGLIEDETHLDKREAELNEDEDLEHGINKIDLIKLDDNDERAKRADVAEKPSKRSEAATKHYEMIEIPEPKIINEEEYIDEYLNKNEDQSKELEKKDKEKRSDDVAAEMERQIKSKLQKIKEEVRHEIDKIKSSNNEEFDEVDGDEEEKTDEKETLQRRKRNVINTLIEEETSDINPIISGDNSLIPHIRRRRKRDIMEDMSGDYEEEPIQDFERSEDEVRLLDSINPVDSRTVSVIDRRETSFIIDLNPKMKSEQTLSSSIKQKRCTDKEPTLKMNGRKNIKSKSNDEYDQRKGTDWRDEDKGTKEQLQEKTINNTLLKSHAMILDRLTELKSLEHGKNIENIKSLHRPTGGDSSYESTPTNLYYTTIEQPFLMRNLKEYDDESSNDNVDMTNFEKNDDKADLNKDKSLKGDKKGCKCNNGDKDCKCGNAPVKLLQGSDGSNFVYIDDVPRLANGPSSGKLSNEKEEYDDQENPAVEIKLNPLTTDKKRSAKENIKYHKSVVKFHKSLRDGGYTLDIDPDIYRITEENPKSFASRKKRDSFADLVAIHGGGPVINHLIAVKERSMLPRIRVKRGTQPKDQPIQQLTLKDLSDEDLFGALPQSYEGELTRFKRVKRTS